MHCGYTVKTLLKDCINIHFHSQSIHKLENNILFDITIRLFFLSLKSCTFLIKFNISTGKVQCINSLATFTLFCFFSLVFVYVCIILNIYSYSLPHKHALFSCCFFIHITLAIMLGIKVANALPCIVFGKKTERIFKGFVGTLYGWKLVQY